MRVRTGRDVSIYDAAMAYQKEGTPLVIIAGQEYGTGSSRDWAAKGTALLGVKAVVAQSFERIHRSNLVGMGVLPLQFKEGTTAQTLEAGRHGDLRRARPGRRAQAAAGSDACASRAQTGRWRLCPYAAASIRRSRSTTTSTAAFCRMCCGSWHKRRAPAPEPPRWRKCAGLRGSVQWPQPPSKTPRARL